MLLSIHTLLQLHPMTYKVDRYHQQMPVTSSTILTPRLFTSPSSDISSMMWFVAILYSSGDNGAPCISPFLMRILEDLSTPTSKTVLLLVWQSMTMFLSRVGALVRSNDFFTWL
uniref:Uncharacterized protein n=1 Tax=Cacopsylla melanoneura TaxID=428564 RepID=A0A8D8YRD7_9HEMI